MFAWIELSLIRSGMLDCQEKAMLQSAIVR
jgi:hypothetical protein